jgi:hypothetical protein
MKFKTLGLTFAFMFAAHAHSLESSLAINHKIDYTKAKAEETTNAEGEVEGEAKEEKKEKSSRPYATELSYKASHDISLGNASFDFKVTKDSKTYKSVDSKDAKHYDIDIKGNFGLSSKKALDVSFEKSPIEDIVFGTEVHAKTNNNKFFKDAKTSVSNSLSVNWKSSYFESLKSMISISTSDIRKAYKADKSLAPIKVKQCAKTVFVPVLASSAQFVAEVAGERLDANNYVGSALLGINYDLAPLFGMSKKSVLWSVNLEGNQNKSYETVDSKTISTTTSTRALSTKVSYSF